jgi:3-dehydroquinate dehydratase-2
MKQILIINGPNLNLLGKREPDIYGNRSFVDYLKTVEELFPDVQLRYFQSNHEGELLDKIHELGFTIDGIVINAGAYTHISNVHARESFRHHSYLSAKCKGLIVGLGLTGYELAIRYLLTLP